MAFFTRTNISYFTIALVRCRRNLAMATMCLCLDMGVLWIGFALEPLDLLSLDVCHTVLAKPGEESMRSMRC